MTTLALGALALIAAAIFHHYQIFTRGRAYLAFAGTCVVASGGWFGSLLNRGAHIVSNVAGTTTGKVFGVAIPGLIVLVIGLILVIHLHPKGRGASRSTMFLAVALAACLVAGVSTIRVLDAAPATVRTSISSVTGG